MELHLPIFAPLLKGLSTGCHRQFWIEWSANSLMSDVTPSVMSLLKSKKRPCPKTDPWGTPDVTGTWPENSPATTICWVLSDRKSLKNPGCCIPLNTIRVKLVHKSAVSNFIEGLTEFHDDGVYLTSLDGTLAELMNELNKLRLTGQTSSEAMLALVEDVIVI